MTIRRPGCSRYHKLPVSSRDFNFRGYTFLTLTLALLFSLPSFAQRRQSNPTTSKVGLSYSVFSGEDNKSLSKGNPGIGGEVGVDAGFRFIRYYAKVKALTSSGTQPFLDNTTAVRANYSLTQIAPELGVSLYPIGRPDRGMGVYFFAGGILSMNLLELKPVSEVDSGTAITTFERLKTREQNFGAGFSGGIGVELLWGRAKSAKNMLYAEVGVKQMNVSLAGQSDFALNDLTFTLGFGF